MSIMNIFGKRNPTFHKEYHTDRLVLRIFKPDCAQLALDYYKRNKDFLAEWDPDRDSFFYTRQGQIETLKYEFAEFLNKRLIRFWIFKKGDDSKTIGNLCFSNIIYGNFKSCFLGYKLDKDEINNGYMTEAVSKGMEIMFTEYNLHRVEVNIIPRNLKSMRVAEKLKLEREGFSKRYLLINGIWENHVHFAAYSDMFQKETTIAENKKED